MTPKSSDIDSNGEEENDGGESKIMLFGTD